MRANWEQTDNIFQYQVEGLALIYISNPYVGVMGRWYCPLPHVAQVVSKVKKFVDNTDTDYVINIRSKVPQVNKVRGILTKADIKELNQMMEDTVNTYSY